MFKHLPVFIVLIVSVIGCDDGTNQVINEVVDDTASTIKAIAKPSIQGKWQHSSGSTIEFFPDGTYKEAGWLATTNGKYVLLDNSRVKFEVEQMLGGTGVGTAEYKVENDELTIILENGVTTNYTKMK